MCERRETAMTYLILSDSHGHPDRIEEVIRRVRPDGILFAGDGLRDLTRVDFSCPLWAVTGNCDWLSVPLVANDTLLEPRDEDLIILEGVRILLMHGHTYSVKGGLGSAVARAVQQEADLLIYGHTHLPVELHLRPDDRRADFGVTKPLTLFNPGSLGDRDASFGTLTVRNGQILLGHGSL
ncbi:MAG: metallophosphoesterase family protein [Clostridia bacterium]|nr:metallophosphoesterase family protein [Clostridia bacterium]